MALFNKESSKPKKTSTLPKTSPALSKEAISSIISPEMNISGEINFKGKTRLDGTLDGDLNGEYIILSETGVITGDLNVETLICHGKINGNIHAKIVTIHSTAAIQGKLVAASLTVEPGALLTGEISAAYKEQTAQSAISQTEKKLIDPEKTVPGKKQK